MTAIRVRLACTSPVLAAALLAFGGFAGAPASAQCVKELENGYVLVADLTGNQILWLDDVSHDADPDNNQRPVCVGTDEALYPMSAETEPYEVAEPRAITNDRFGRLWISRGGSDWGELSRSRGPNVVRVDPTAERWNWWQTSPTSGTQVALIWWNSNLGADPQGIVKEPNGDVFVAQSGAITSYDPVTGFRSSSNPWTGSTGLGEPYGLIRDPHTNAAPRNMLLSQLLDPNSGIAAGAYSANESGVVERVATHGLIAAPYRIAAVGDRFIYLTDAGGLMDPDGTGPEPEVTRPAQVIQIDRSVAVDFDDPEVDHSANQNVVAATFDSLDRPIGIAVLEGDGVDPDTLIVAVSRIPDEVGRVVRIDFDPDDPSNPATTTTRVISRGQQFVKPWDVHIVEGIDPDPEPLIYVTDYASSAQGELAGVYAIDPTAPEPTQPQPLATGAPFAYPNGIVVDPDDTNRLLVADSGLPGVIEVDATTGATRIVSQNSTPGSGGPFVDPTYLIVDAAGEILVTDSDGKRLLRIDSNDVAQILSPVPGEEDFFYRPVGVAIDPEGYLLVTDSYDPWVGENNGRLIRVSPATGRQWCIADGIVAGTPWLSWVSQHTFSLAGVGDLLFDTDGSLLVTRSGENPFMFRPYAPQETQILRLSPSPFGFFEEWYVSNWMGNPVGLAIAENRDILTLEPSYANNSRVLRVDPLLPPGQACNAENYLNGCDLEPLGTTVVPNSTGLSTTFGMAVAGKPRPNPAPVDTDGDGVPDLEDNCIEHPNPDQAEGNLGFGVVCDTGCYDTSSSCLRCDASGDNVVGGPDFTILVAEIGNDCNPPSTHTACSADCTGDDRVGSPDFAMLFSELGSTGSEPAGPKGVLLDQDPECP